MVNRSLAQQRQSHTIDLARLIQQKSRQNSIGNKKNVSGLTIRRGSQVQRSRASLIPAFFLRLVDGGCQPRLLSLDAPSSVRHKTRPLIPHQQHRFSQVVSFLLPFFPLLTFTLHFHKNCTVKHVSRK